MTHDYPIDIRNTAKTAKNLKPGDVVEINWYHQLGVENRDVTEEGIEFLGELQNQTEERRVLFVETTRMTPPVLSTPERTDPIVVVDIKPVGETMLSSKLASQWMKTNVSVDHSYRARRIEVSQESGQKVGECPVCSDSMYLDKGKNIVGCRECGVWVETEVWQYWSERSKHVEFKPDAYADDKKENEESIEYWLTDFQD